MNFHGMKRKQLQSLCKKHGIPANLKNKEMAHRLSFILKGKENHGSCQSGSDNYGTDKNMLDVEINELNSSNDNEQQTVTQDNAAGHADAREVKSVSSRKRSPSPDSEERIGFSPNLLKTSENKRLQCKTNLTLGTPTTCDMEENIQSGVNEIEGQVNDDIHEVLHAAVHNAVVMNDVDLVKVASEEFGNNLVEEEIDKLDDNNDIHNHEDDCGTEKGELDAEKQDDTNSPHGSNRSIDIDQMVSSDTFELMLPMSQETSVVADPKDCFDFSSKPLEASVIEKLEEFDNSQEVFPTASNDSVINDANLLQISLQDSDYNWEEEVHKKPGDNICVHDVCNIGNGGSEVDTICPAPDSFIGAEDTHEKTNVTAEHFLNEVNSSSCHDSVRTLDQFLPSDQFNEVKSSNLIISEPEECIEFSPKHLKAPVIKGFEIETNLNPITFGNEKKDEFVPTMPQSGEIKSGNLNIHQMFASDTASGDEDIDQGKLELSQKITPVTSAKESSKFPPKLLESPIMKEFQTKMNMPIETCDMKENMQSIKKEQVGTLISKETISKRQALQDLQQK